MTLFCPQCQKAVAGAEAAATPCPQCGGPLAAPPAPPSTAADDALPSVLGRYRIVDRIAAGNFAVVYRARDLELDREVAIKLLHQKLINSPRVLDSFLTEAKILASLTHPAIVPIYDIGRTEDGGCYLITRLIVGTDLKRKLQTGRLPRTDAVEITATVAEALHYAHQHGLVHRDVKPANILLDVAGHPLLADFGLALRGQDFGKGPTNVGTPLYMSPEQARKESHLVDARTDIYSLGIVFYELLTGQHPFQGTTLAELLNFIRNQEAQPPRQLDDTIPVELERVWGKATALLASDRYDTARDFADDLRHWQARQLKRALGKEGQPGSKSNWDLDLPRHVVPHGLRAFDAEDADFFLDLLPGPRNRNGLPESIAFWKTRLECSDADATFRVGLLYGPSGCGKSSLVQAGLLPRLAGRVVPLFVEATPNQTEARLLKGLHRLCPGLPAEQGLVEALRNVRNGQGLPPGQKFVFILDQFEQWLHAPRMPDNVELVEALRQCDGGRVQAVLLVRSDFWLTVSRFMHDLEVPFIEGQNTAFVDLFDPFHARHVLAEFGRAFGRLPDPLTDCTPEQNRFLTQAVAELTEDGKVIPVHLSVFADIIKGKPWTPHTLDALGGAEGVGMVFLEEAFAAASAPAEYRQRALAARAVLQALLPMGKAEIKGRRRSREHLLAVSGYAQRPDDFAALMRILDQELRLVSPALDDAAADHEAQEKKLMSETMTPQHRAILAAPQYYQLTHDFMVPTLRDWLTSKQRETRSGRAALRLADYAVSWNVRPSSRRLPKWWEWLTIALLTRRRDWTNAQQKMMREASFHHMLRLTALACLLAAVGVAGLHLRRQAVNERNLLRADHLVARIQEFHESHVSQFRTEIELNRDWTIPKLQALIDDPTTSDNDRRHARLVLLPLDDNQLAPLQEDLLTCGPVEVREICTELAPYKAEVLSDLWTIAADGRAERKRRLRTAGALAVLDPDNPRWHDIRADVVNALVVEPLRDLGEWLETFRPVRLHLLGPLCQVFHDKKHPALAIIAANILVDYAADQPEVLAALLKDAEDWQRAFLNFRVPALAPVQPR